MTLLLAAAVLIWTLPARAHRAVKRCRGGCSCDPEPRCNGERKQDG